MKLEIPIEELRKRKIFFCTPMYGGQCYGVFTQACIDLGMLAMRHGITVQFYFLYNESLITRARNYLADEFLRSDCTHLMFVDSDIHFNPRDVLAFAALDRDIVCGPYPKKVLAVERMVEAVRYGVVTQDQPQALEQFAGDYVFNPVPGTTQIRIDEPVQVLEGGTGFMMIKRSVFERFKAAYPELSYKPDHNRTKYFNGTREIHAYFDTVIEPKSRRYLSEDYMFCQWARQIGCEIWLCPWIELKHSGTYVFGGSLQAVANLDAAKRAVSAVPAANVPLPVPPPVSDAPQVFIPAPVDNTTEKGAE